MSLEFTKNIDVDIYDRKIVRVNAKQYDATSRFLLVTCYAQKKLLPLNSMYYSVIVRVKKPDGYCAFNDCSITEEGKVLVELTEQILAAEGNAYLDLIIMNTDYSDGSQSSNAINVGTGNILSTMTICVNVVPAACDCWDIESSNEFIALNHALIEAQNNYQGVMTACKNSEANMQSISNSLGGVFSPRGTVTFSELSSVTKATGYVYHINEEFVTNNTFKCGAGVTIPKGTNIYWTADGYWDYFVEGMLVANDDGSGNVDLAWESYIDESLKIFDDNAGNVALLVM